MKEIIFALFLLAGAYKAIILLPEYLDVTLILLGASILTVMKDLIKRPKFQRYVQTPIALYAVFSSIIIASLFYTESSGFALEKTLRFVFITGWAFCGALLIIRTERSLKLFCITFISVSSIMSLVAIFIYYQNNNYGVTSVFGSNYLMLGRLTAIAIILLMGLQFKHSIKYGLMCLNFSALLISGGRAPLLFFIMTLFLIPFYYLKIGKRDIKINKGILTHVTVFFILLGLGFFIYVNAGVIIPEIAGLKVPF